MRVSTLANPSTVERAAAVAAGINPAAPVVVRCQTLVLAPLAVVWRVLTDFEQWPAWLPEISGAHLDDPLGPGATVRWETTGLPTAATITVAVPFERLGWIERSTGIRAIQMWTLRTVNGAVCVTAEESWEGEMVSAHSRALTRGLHACVQEWLSRLKRRSESGAISAAATCDQSYGVVRPSPESTHDGARARVSVRRG
jgi:uncharacterized protein YndB with AHSA1/START domain